MRTSLYIALFFVFLFSVPKAFAESPWRCDSTNQMHFVLVSKPANILSPWLVEFFTFNSAKKDYVKATNLKCQEKLGPSQDKAETILAVCEVIYGPDGGEGLTISSLNATGGLTATLLPWGPTGNGAVEKMKCAPGVN